MNIDAIKSRIENLKKALDDMKSHSFYNVHYGLIETDRVIIEITGNPLPSCQCCGQLLRGNRR